MENKVSARPPLKWVGGKTALLPEILPRLPKKIGTYFEPFVGGGAVFFALAAEGRFKRAVLGDANEELMNVYAALERRPEKIINTLKDHIYEEAYYYKVRALDPRSLDDATRAARFIYLNKTCFNGLHRVNKKGQFNVPFGRYTNPTICDEENLRAVSKVLQGVELSSFDFGHTLHNARRGDVCYLDCPYFPVSVTSNFTAYTGDGFGYDDQVRLRDVSKKLIERGVYVLLSNSDTPTVRKLYKGFKLEKVQAPRRVNSKGGKRGNVGELLISTPVKK